MLLITVEPLRLPTTTTPAFPSPPPATLESLLFSLLKILVVTPLLLIPLSQLLILNLLLGLLPSAMKLNVDLPIKMIMMFGLLPMLKPLPVILAVPLSPSSTMPLLPFLVVVTLPPLLVSPLVIHANNPPLSLLPLL